MSVPRVGYLVSHPIQYHAPLFRRLAVSPRIAFVALFGSHFGVEQDIDPSFGEVVDFQIELLNGYESLRVPQGPRHARIDHFMGLRTPSIGTVLSLRPLDVLILHGWRTAMMWQAAVATVCAGVPYLLRAETPSFVGGKHLRRGPRRVARDVAVRGLVSCAAGALVLGKANERFYREYGCPSDKFYRVPYCVDDAAVRAAASEGREERGRLLATMGVPEDAFVVVSVGKLIRRKRHSDLVRALALLPVGVHLVVIGSGELRDDLSREAAAHGVSARVHLIGFLSSPDVWRALGASDLFALPSESEPWGLAVNEAVIAGLPTIVTHECGSAESLVSPGATGDVVPVGDVAAWSAAIARWIERNKRGDRGDEHERRRISHEHSLERAAAGIESAVIDVSRGRAKPHRSQPGDGTS